MEEKELEKEMAKILDKWLREVIDWVARNRDKPITIKRCMEDTGLPYYIVLTVFASLEVMGIIGGVQDASKKKSRWFR